MFVAQKECGWNIVSKAMKCATAVTYRGFRLGEAPMRDMKLLLANDEYLLLRGEVDWVRAGLCIVWTLEVLEQSLNLRQAVWLEWVIVGGKSGAFIFEARLFVALGGSNTWYF